MFFADSKVSEENSDSSSDYIKEPSQKLELFVIHYADFCFGDIKSESCDSFQLAKAMALKKPRDSSIAYQYWRKQKKLHTKPVDKNPIWTNEKTGDGLNQNGHLFVWAYDTNMKLNGRHLILLKGVDIDGGDEGSEYCKSYEEVIDHIFERG